MPKRGVTYPVEHRSKQRLGHAALRPLRGASRTSRLAPLLLHSTVSGLKAHRLASPSGPGQTQLATSNNRSARDNLYAGPRDPARACEKARTALYGNAQQRRGQAQVMLEATRHAPKTVPPSERTDEEKNPEAVKRGAKGGAQEDGRAPTHSATSVALRWRRKRLGPDGRQIPRKTEVVSVPEGCVDSCQESRTLCREQ